MCVEGHQISRATVKKYTSSRARRNIRTQVKIVARPPASGGSDKSPSLRDPRLRVSNYFRDSQKRDRGFVDRFEKPSRNNLPDNPPITRQKLANFFFFFLFSFDSVSRSSIFMDRIVDLRTFRYEIILSSNNYFREFSDTEMFQNFHKFSARFTVYDL